MGKEGIEEGRKDDVGMVGGSHWCECKGEGVGCTPAQTKLPWLSVALGVANGASDGLGGSYGRRR